MNAITYETHFIAIFIGHYKNWFQGGWKFWRLAEVFSCCSQSIKTQKCRKKLVLHRPIVIPTLLSWHRRKNCWQEWQVFSITQNSFINIYDPVFFEVQRGTRFHFNLLRLSETKNFFGNNNNNSNNIRNFYDFSHHQINHFWWAKHFLDSFLKEKKEKCFFIIFFFLPISSFSKWKTYNISTFNRKKWFVRTFFYESFKLHNTL